MSASMAMDLVASTSVLAMVTALAGCVPIPPPNLEISDVPPVSGSSCTVTIVRRNQFAGSFPTHYISLDGRIVAAIERGQYTVFPVSEGLHSLATTWRVGDELLGVGGYGGGIGAVKWNPHSRIVQSSCHPPASYFFTINALAFPPSLQALADEDARVEFVQVDALRGDFVLDKSRYVPPGPQKAR